MRRLLWLLLLLPALPAWAATYSISVDGCSACAPVTAQQADPLVQMIGVNTHLSFSGSSYNNTTTIINALTYLNVWKIRDYALISGNANTPSSYNTVAAAGGKFLQQVGTGFVCTTTACVTNVLNSTFGNINTFLTAYPGAVLGIEGANEVNNFAVGYPPAITGNPAAAEAWQQDIYTYAVGDAQLSGLPILNFTDEPVSGTVGTFTTNNIHVYTYYGEQNACPACLADFQRGYNAGFINSSAPIWVTETGYMTCTSGGQGCVDWTSVGPMILNDLFDFYFIGCCGGSGFSGHPSPAMVFEYELLDEDNSGNGWGLFYSNGTPKSSATGIKNLITILSDPGASFSPGSLSFAASGLNPGNGSDHAGSKINLLQKRNGTFEIILQNQQLTYNWTSSSYAGCSNYAVTINLEKVASMVKVYDPITGAAPISSYPRAQAVTVTSCMDPLIIEVIP